MILNLISNYDNYSSVLMLKIWDFNPYMQRLGICRKECSISESKFQVFNIKSDVY